MEKLIPFFELNDHRYEIKPSRHLYAEYQRLQDEVEIDEEMQINVVKVQNLKNDLEKYRVKVDEFEQKFFETFDDEDERRYLKAKELFNRTFNELAELEASSKSSTLVYKKSLDVLEQIAIWALADQYFNKDFAQGKKLWEEFVSENGQDTAVEWLAAMAQCLFIKDEEEEPKNPFLAQMRKRQKANRKK